MTNMFYLIKGKIVSFSSKFFPDFFKDLKSTIVNWVYPKIQNFPAILILVLASLGCHSVICDCSVWVLLKELPFIFSTTICIPSAVSVLFVILLVKIIEYNEKRRMKC